MFLQDTRLIRIFLKSVIVIIFLLSAGWIGNDAVSPIIGKHDPYYHLTGRVSTEIIIELIYLWASFLFSFSIILLQEQGDLRFVAVLMTFAVLVSILSTIAIVRRILMATSVLKASKNDCSSKYISPTKMHVTNQAITCI